MVGSVSDRLVKGGDVLRELAKEVERVEQQRDAYQRESQETFRDVENLERILDEREDAEPVLDDLEDLRRGVITPEEMYNKWLERIPASVPWAVAA